MVNANRELSATEARRHWSTALNRVTFGGERLTITKQGQAVAVLISAEEARLLEALEDQVLGRLAEEAVAEMERNGEQPRLWEDVKRDLGL